MAALSKKVLDRFIKTIPKFQRVLQLAKDRDVNESDTCAILSDILGEVFGYDKYLEVTSEFAIRGTYCDLALKVDDKVHFILEAKAIGIDLKDAHVRQAIDYGSNKGISWIILTNGLEWRLYHIRFEQPINFDLVCCFDFLSINTRDEKELDRLFILTKEGLAKNSREEFFEKIQSVNRYIIGNLILSSPVISMLRRELFKISDGVRVEEAEILQIIHTEVLKREVVEGDEADAAKARVTKFYKKTIAKKTQKKQTTEQPGEESITEKLLNEAQ